MKTRLMQSLFLCALLFGAFCLSACGPDLSSPDATLTTYAAAMQAKDKDAMLACMVESERAEAKKQWDEAESKKKEGEEKKFTVTSKGTTKDGAWTIGTLELKEEGGSKGMEMKTVLVEVDGKWYVSDKKSAEYTAEQIKKMFEKTE
jgi:hypothetical protein